MLNDKVVLITGATGGLGVAVTKAFLDAGATVAGSSRSIKAADFPHPNFAAFPAEDALVAKVVARYGRIDVLVHLVGAFDGGKPTEETSEETLDKMLEINLKSFFRIVREVLPGMKARRGGVILAIGSRAAVEPSASVSAYALSKAALVSLIRSIAAENKDFGVTANIVLPGTMDTAPNRAAMPNADFTKWVSPVEVAGMLVHLASAPQVTGAVIPIYGGE
jgi:NAD(P)-dependent dehydrogenase (short-subunit alcohol dehydrogenase family)